MRAPSANDSARRQRKSLMPRPRKYKPEQIRELPDEKLMQLMMTLTAQGARAALGVCEYARRLAVSRDPGSAFNFLIGYLESRTQRP